MVLAVLERRVLTRSSASRLLGSLEGRDQKGPLNILCLTAVAVCQLEAASAMPSMSQSVSGGKEAFQGRFHGSGSLPFSAVRPSLKRAHVPGLPVMSAYVPDPSGMSSKTSCRLILESSKPSPFRMPLL